MSEKLAVQTCIPCSIETPAMSGEILYNLLNDLDKDWMLVDELSLERTFKFKNFALALEFVNKVAVIAEAEGHHPDIDLSYGRVKIKLITHKINGLSRNDFILAAKIDELTMFLLKNK